MSLDTLNDDHRIHSWGIGTLIVRRLNKYYGQPVKSVFVSDGRQLEDVMHSLTGNQCSYLHERSITTMQLDVHCYSERAVPLQDLLQKLRFFETNYCFKGTPLSFTTGVMTLRSCSDMPTSSISVFLVLIGSPFTAFKYI